MRIKKHPILSFQAKEIIDFVYNGQQVHGLAGDTIASALHALGIKELSKSSKSKRSRGFFCAIGNCSSCQMTVDGVPNVKTCITKLEQGMVVTSDEGLGVLK
ncbi:MAG: (2Fe-2S)-binding protein [Candidatus Izemoplasmatales bacterium]|jgi:predicted molibdopterin-dependent oxidoreductase YjgC